MTQSYHFYICPLRSSHSLWWAINLFEKKTHEFNLIKLSSFYLNPKIIQIRAHHQMMNIVYRQCEIYQLLTTIISWHITMQMANKKKRIITKFCPLNSSQVWEIDNMVSSQEVSPQSEGNGNLFSKQKLENCE